jgi:spore coat protein U-like protein
MFSGQHRKVLFSSLGLGAMLAAGLPAAPAAAVIQTTTMTVSASVQATCLISAAPLAFGTYSGTLAQVTSTITVTCTNTTPYDVALNPGTASGATVTTRQMTGPSSDLLNYALYSDASYSKNWGETIGTDTVSGTGNSSAQTLTVYGQIPANQYVTPGDYSDTVTATVNY